MLPPTPARQYGEGSARRLATPRQLSSVQSLASPSTSKCRWVAEVRYAGHRKRHAGHAASKRCNWRRAVQKATGDMLECHVTNGIIQYAAHVGSYHAVPKAAPFHLRADAGANVEWAGQPANRPHVAGLRPS